MPQTATTRQSTRRKMVEALLSQPIPNDVKRLPPDEAAWPEILASFAATRNRSVAGKPQRWTCEDYYDDPRYQRNNWVN